MGRASMKETFTPLPKPVYPFLGWSPLPAISALVPVCVDACVVVLTETVYELDSTVIPRAKPTG